MSTAVSVTETGVVVYQPAHAAALQLIVDTGAPLSTWMVVVLTASALPATS